MKNLKKCFSWLKKGLTNIGSRKIVLTAEQKAYRKKERLVTLAAYFTVITIIGLPILISSSINISENSSKVKAEYLTASYEAAIIYSTDISTYILRMNSETLTEEKVDLLINVCDMQIKADQRIIDFDNTDLEEFKEFHFGLRSLCSDDITAVQAIKDSLEHGLVPPAELQKGYISLRSENYLWVLLKYEEEYLKMLNDSIWCN